METPGDTSPRTVRARTPAPPRPEPARRPWRPAPRLAGTALSQVRQARLPLCRARRPRSRTERVVDLGRRADQGPTCRVSARPDSHPRTVRGQHSNVRCATPKCAMRNSKPSKRPGKEVTALAYQHARTKSRAARTSRPTGAAKTREVKLAVAGSAQTADNDECPPDVRGRTPRPRTRGPRTRAAQDCGPPPPAAAPLGFRSEPAGAPPRRVPARRPPASPHSPTAGAIPPSASRSRSPRGHAPCPAAPAPGPGS